MTFISKSRRLETCLGTDKIVDLIINVGLD